MYINIYNYYKYNYIYIYCLRPFGVLLSKVMRKISQIQVVLRAPSRSFRRHD